MSQQNELIVRITALSDSYLARVRAGVPEPELLRDDWTKALDFWFHRSFFRGRRDELSERFMNAATRVLDADGHAMLRAVTAGGVDARYGGDLDARLRAGGVTNEGDRLMVVGSLTLCAEIDDHNLVRWAVDETMAGRVQSVIRRLKAIEWVGPKIASFFLRDLDFLFGLAQHLKPNQQVLLQPIDVWVKKVSAEAGITSPGANDRAATREIVRGAQAANVDPARYNVGAWMVGKENRASDISFEEALLRLEAGAG